MATVGVLLFKEGAGAGPRVERSEASIKRSKPQNVDGGGAGVQKGGGAVGATWCILSTYVGFAFSGGTWGGGVYQNEPVVRPAGPLPGGVGQIFGRNPRWRSRRAKPAARHRCPALRPAESAGRHRHWLFHFRPSRAEPHCRSIPMSRCRGPGVTAQHPWPLTHMVSAHQKSQALRSPN